MVNLPEVPDVGGLAREEAPLILAEEVECPVVEVGDLFVAVDGLAEGVALHLHEEFVVCAARDYPADDALKVEEGGELLVVDAGDLDGAADPVEAVVRVGPAEGGLRLGLGGPEDPGLGVEDLGLGRGLGGGLGLRQELAREDLTLHFPFVST